MSDLDRRRLMMGSRKIPDFIIFDGTLKAGSVLGKSYSSISSAGYINICGGTRTIGGGYKGYSGDVWSENEAIEAAEASGYEYIGA